jgi:hypothetical protein
MTNMSTSNNNSNSANPAVPNHTSNNQAVPHTHTNNVPKTNSAIDNFPNASVNKGLGSNPESVSYEEYAKLKDRVHLLESELDVVKKQLKLLLDRDLSQGHIV